MKNGLAFEALLSNTSHTVIRNLAKKNLEMSKKYCVFLNEYIFNLAKRFNIQFQNSLKRIGGLKRPHPSKSLQPFFGPDFWEVHHDEQNGREKYN